MSSAGVEGADARLTEARKGVFEIGFLPRRFLKTPNMRLSGPEKLKSDVVRKVPGIDSSHVTFHR